MRVSPADWRRPQRQPHVRRHAVGDSLVLLVSSCLGPMLWLAKLAFTPTQDTLTQAVALFPQRRGLGQPEQAWSTVHIGLYFLNTVVLAVGSWACRSWSPRPVASCCRCCGREYAQVLTALLLTTLFVPAVVLLVPLYIGSSHPPLIGPR